MKVRCSGEIEKNGKATVALFIAGHRFDLSAQEANRAARYMGSVAGALLVLRRDLGFESAAPGPRPRALP